MRVGILNPLPRVLGHFQRSLVDNLDVHDDLSVIEFVVVGTEMPIGSGTFARIRAALRFIRDARRLGRREDIDQLINLWPSFGYLEALVWRLVRPRFPVWTILHDARPLRHQFGYWERAVKPLALGRRGSHAWLVHSDAAKTDALDVGLGVLNVLPHPITPTGDEGIERSVDVLVFGQYKPTRDMDLLASLGPALQRRGQIARIVGRGWPAIPGWEVDERFVDEADVPKLLGEAKVVLIPYERYYQSGVALRAMEVGTPVAGVRTPFLEQYVGENWPGLIEPTLDSVDAWIEALGAASLVPAHEVLFAAEVARDNVSSAWRNALLRDVVA